MEEIICDYCGEIYLLKQDRYFPRRCCSPCSQRKLKRIYLRKQEITKIKKKIKKLNKIQEELRLKKVREASKKSYYKNIGKRLFYYRQLAVKRKNIKGTFTKKDWEDLLVSQNHKCEMCSEFMNKPTIDHIIPISKWNIWAELNKPSYECNDIENIQALCGRCNCRKSNKLSLS